MKHRQNLFPVLRWVGFVWLLVWIPVNAKYYGAVNFLHECDVAVILTAIGLWYSNALLLSSQAIGILIPDFLWCADAAWRVLLGHHLIGGTEYMWDTQFPLWVRLLSLFHVALPLILIYAVARRGYDRRAIWLQLAIFAGLLEASRFTPADLNINFAYLDPITHRWWGPAPLHFAIIMAGAMVAFFPVHWMFLRFMPAAGVKADERTFGTSKEARER
jgi:hypothetical protein